MMDDQASVYFALDAMKLTIKKGFNSGQDLQVWKVALAIINAYRPPTVYTLPPGEITS